MTLMAQALTMMVVLMSLLWLVHLRIRNAAVVDVGWAAGLGIVAALYAILGEGLPERRLALAAMVGIWSLRLSLHLFFDRVAGKPEEGRYVQLRRRWKVQLPAKFLAFFLFQAVLNVLISVPFLLIARNPSSAFSPLELIGAMLWLVAVFGEAVADKQLQRFKADPSNSGQVCRVGLWKYSRHPNYFFEWLIWVAFSIMALPVPNGWVAVLSPAIILYFLFRITGIPATEEQAIRTRGEPYREYQKMTSPFVPWFPARIRRDGRHPNFAWAYLEKKKEARK